MKNVSLVRKFHTSSVPNQFTVKYCVHNTQLKVWTAVRLEFLSILLFFLICALWMAERVGKWWKCAALYLIFQRLLTYSKQIYFGVYKGCLISALNLCHVLWFSFYFDLCDEYENNWYLSSLSLALEVSTLGWQSPSFLLLNKKREKALCIKVKALNVGKLVVIKMYY